jgi:hypothetical protein
VVVLLWEAGTVSGVCDDKTRAMHAAQACMNGSASYARVERARLIFGLTAHYERLGEGWEMRDNRWIPFSLPTLAAS